MVTTAGGSGQTQNVRPNKEWIVIKPSTKSCRPGRVNGATLLEDRSELLRKSNYPKHSSDKHREEATLDGPATGQRAKSTYRGRSSSSVVDDDDNFLHPKS